MVHPKAVMTYDQVIPLSEIYLQQSHPKFSLTPHWKKDRLSKYGVGHKPRASNQF